MVNSNVIDANITNSFSELSKQSNQKIKQDDEIKQENSIVPQAADTEIDSITSFSAKRLGEQQDKAVSEEEKNAKLEEAYKAVSEFMNVYNRNVSFSKADDGDTTVIKVFDADSKELIKQFPSEDLIELAKKINELRQDIDLKSGIFLDEKV